MRCTELLPNRLAVLHNITTMAETQCTHECRFMLPHRHKTINGLTWEAELGIIQKDHDPVERPAGYTYSVVEPIEVIEAWELGFCLGNAVKYIARCGRKPGTDPVQDLKKAIWYIQRRIKELNDQNIHSKQMEESGKTENGAGPAKRDS